MTYTKPTLHKGPASNFASPNEMIWEFGTGRDGTGGLLSLTNLDDGALRLDIYRVDGPVLILSPQLPAEQQLQAHTPDELAAFARLVDKVTMNLPGHRPRAFCACGTQIVYTGDGWQHDSAPWFWGDDHDAQWSVEAQALADAWDLAHPDEDDEEDDGDYTFDTDYGIHIEGDAENTQSARNLEVGDTFKDPAYDEPGDEWHVADSIRIVGDTVHVYVGDTETTV